MISVVSSSSSSPPSSSPSSSPTLSPPPSLPLSSPSLLSPFVIGKADDESQSSKESKPQPLPEETNDCLISLIKTDASTSQGDVGFGMSAISTKRLSKPKPSNTEPLEEKKEVNPNKDDQKVPKERVDGREYCEKEGLFVRDTKRLCKICDKVEGAAYQCPRCEIPYCSLTCYKSHNQTCTEGFYKDQVDKELKTKTSTYGAQKKMMDKLKNLHLRDVEGGGDFSLTSTNNFPDDPDNKYAPFQRPFSDYGAAALDDFEDEEEALFALFDKDIHEKLASLPDLNPDSIVQFLSSLPEEKINRFATAALDGTLSHLMEPWVPWWFEKNSSSVLLGASGANGFIQEVDGNGGERSDKEGGEGKGEGGKEQVAVVPDPGPIKPFSEIFPSSKKPSPTLPYDLVDLLFGYGIMMRRCNGEWNDASVLASCVEDVFSFSQVIGEGRAFESMSLVFEGKVAIPSLMRDEVLAISLDCLSILKRKRYVLGALGDLCRLFRTFLSKSNGRNAGKRKGKEEEEDQEGVRRSKELIRKTKMAERKLNFFLSWGCEQAPSAFEGLAIQAMVEQGNLKVEPKRSFVPKKKTVLLPVRK